MATQLQDGTWEAVIDPGLGPDRVQRFTAPTLEALTAKMENAQLHATQRIHGLNEYLNPDKADMKMPEFKPRTLSADELAQTAVDLQQPGTMQGAVERLIEAAVGAKPQQIREGLQSAHLSKVMRHYQLETQEFIDNTPEYKKTPKNWEAMMRYLDAEDAPPSKKNLTIAFNKLRNVAGGLPDGVNEAGAAEEEPNKGEEHIAPAGERHIDENPKPTTRPRGTQSSGIRNATPSNPPPPPPSKQWTRKQVLAMGAEEYEQLYKSNHKFREFVDTM